MVSAKSSSLIAQIVACVWVAGMAILKGLSIIKMEMMDIIISGGAIAAVFSPTFVSIWLDKIKDIRWGSKQE